jgi:hypothetical protein
VIPIPIYLSDGPNPHRTFTVRRCRFDGEELQYAAGEAGAVAERTKPIDREQVRQ